MKYILEYREEIKKGNIVAGIELITELDKLINDLTNNDKWFIDEVEVEYRIAFIENFVKHTKSPFHGKPFILELWEKAFIEAIYGIKNSRTLRRRFRKVILLIARKNGKSTLCSALTNSELIIGDAGANICVSSNDDSQANIIFQECKDMISISKSLLKRTHMNLTGIFNTKTLSKIFKISDKTKNKEGRNIDLGILDESHEMKNNVIAKSIEQSQSTKEEPLFINITTEGFIVDGYLDEELKHARMVLNDEREDETLLPWLYTQDSEEEIWHDERSWQKSNPSLGTIKKVEYLREQINKARYSTKERVFVLAKDFNIKQNNADAWLLEEDIVNEETFNVEDFRGSYGFGAWDLAETTDLACAGILLIHPKTLKKCVLCMYFIPEAKCSLNSPTNPEKVDYLEYAKQGILKISPGSEINDEEISKWFWEMFEKYDIKIYKGMYDRWRSKSVRKKVDEMFGDHIFEGVLQDHKSFNSPMTLLETDLKSKNVIYNNNELCKMCLRNTAVEVNKYGQQKPIKSSSTKRIDGTVVKIMLYKVYEEYRNELYRINGIEVK
jgi:phage terminase large subunit-like protein